MTIRLLRPFNGYPVGAIVSLGAATETALLRDPSQATSDLTSGFTWEQNKTFQSVSPIPQNQYTLPKPQYVGALAGNLQATVVWSYPTGFVNTKFKITASSVGFSVSVFASSNVGNSVTILGLQNGVSYTFTVQAFNDETASLVSDASTAITPTSLPSSILPVVRGLMFWWSAGNLTNAPANGSELTSLVDLSGCGNTILRQGGAGTGGTWRTNLNSINAAWTLNRRGVDLNGSNQFYASTFAAFYPGKFGTEHSIYIAYGLQATPNANGVNVQCIISDGKSSGESFTDMNAYFEYRTDGAPNSAPTMFNQGNSVVSSTTIAAPSSPQKVTIRAPGNCRVNGTSIGSGSNAIVYPIVRPWLNVNAYAIGCRNGGGFNRHFQGFIAEIIMFNVVHTDAEVALVEQYLNGVI